MDVLRTSPPKLGPGYTFERDLTGGGMSRVVLAHDTALQRDVVFKILLPDLAASVNVERFHREIQLAARLQHPHIVPVLAAGEMDGLPYYTMPYVEGESLRAHLTRGGAMAPDEALRVLHDIGAALVYAHGQGIVHRDLKPENILLSGGIAVVADFGIAKALDASLLGHSQAALTRTGAGVGTPGYMAPEQAVGDPNVDQRADVYSFGVLAYEILTGKAPFAGRDAQSTVAAQFTATPPPLSTVRPELPEPIAHVLMQCLARDPDSRPRSAQQVMSILSTAAHPLRTPRPSAPINGSPAGLLPRALVTYAVAFAVVAAITWWMMTLLGLPDWVFDGALIVMGLGLPMTLLTWFVLHPTQGFPALHLGGAGLHQRLKKLARRARPHFSWMRTVWGGVAALGAFTLVVVGFAVLRSAGVGPWGSLLAAKAITMGQPLLVADFRVTGGDSTLGLVGAELTRASLAQSGLVTVVPTATMGAALRRMQRDATERVTLPTAREIAARDGLNAIVDGDIVVAGDHLIFALRLVTADSGRILFADQRTVKRRDLVKAVDHLSRRMRERIGESMRGIRATPPLENVTTPSLEALRRYTEASRANDLEENSLKAIALAREAIALDTQFAMAWRKLGMVMGNAGQRGPTRDSALHRAFQLRHRLPDQERLLTEASYYWPGPGRDRAKAIAAYEIGLGRGYWEMGNNLAILYQGRREFARAESTYRKVIQARPDFSLPYINIAVTQINLGRLSAAESSLAVARRRFPTNLSAVRDASILLYHLGDQERYQQSVDSLRSSQHSLLRANASYRRAYLALSRGRIADFERFWREGNASAGRSELDVRLLDGVIRSGIDAVVRGDSVGAFRRLDLVLAGVPIRPGSEGATYLLHFVAAYSRAGRADRARNLLWEYEQLLTDTAARRQHSRPLAFIAQAEIALGENRFDDAVRLAREGDLHPDGPVSPCAICLDGWLARAFDRAGQVDSAIVHYERYLRTPYQARYAIDWDLHPFANDPFNLAHTYERLGNLYDAKGQTDRAVEYYSQFVRLWRDAERDLQPRVARARHRLSILSRNKPPPKVGVS